MTATRVRPETPAGNVTGPLVALGVSGLVSGWAVTRCLQTDVLVNGSNMGILALVGVSLVVATGALIAWSGAVDPRRALTLWHGLAAALGAGGIGVLLTNLSGDDTERATVVGVGVLVLAVLLLLLGLSTGARARRRVTLADDVIRTGVEVTGFVAKKGYVDFGESTQVNTPVLFEFTDAEGVERQVEKRLMILRTDPIENGQETTIWYDPADPDDEDRIVVQLQQEHPAP